MKLLQYFRSWTEWGRSTSSCNHRCPRHCKQLPHRCCYRTPSPTPKRFSPIIPRPPKILPPLPLIAYRSQNRRHRSLMDQMPNYRTKLFAQAGFFKIPNHPGNLIQCAFCLLTIWECDYSSWTDPKKEHWLASRRCPFMVNLPTSNVVPKWNTLEEVLAQNFDYAGPYIGPCDYVII